MSNSNDTVQRLKHETDVNNSKAKNSIKNDEVRIENIKFYLFFTKL